MDGCPRYVASNILAGVSGLTADLKLAGKTCNNDLEYLVLVVTHESEIPPRGDWYTHEPIFGEGGPHAFEDQGVTDILLLIRGGVILPVRTESANTTAKLRTRDFKLIVPLDSEGRARGALYLDEGVSLEQDETTYFEFSVEDGTLRVDGMFDCEMNVRICKINYCSRLFAREHS